MTGENGGGGSALVREGCRQAGLIRFLVFLFVSTWIDRINVDLAKLQMLSDLKFGEAVYGFGAGVIILAALLVFWAMPQTFLIGTAVAGGIAAISSAGNLADFVAPCTTELSIPIAGPSTSGPHVVAGFELLAAR